MRDRVMLLLIRFVGENEGNDVDLQPLHNGGSPIILRGEDPPHHHPAVCRTLFLHLSIVFPLIRLPLNIFIPSVRFRFSMHCLYTSLQIVNLCWLQSHTCCICSVSLHVMCSNFGAGGPLTSPLLLLNCKLILNNPKNGTSSGAFSQV